MLSTNLFVFEGFRFSESCSHKTDFIVYGTLVVLRNPTRTIPRRRLHVAGASAHRTAPRSSSSSKGLVRKAEAPALRAPERISESSFPVKMITRVDGDKSRSRDWTSRPFIS